MASLVVVTVAGSARANTATMSSPKMGTPVPRLQPIIVREQAPGRYQLVAGERRWRAARMAGMNEVPVVVREVGDNAALAMARGGRNTDATETANPHSGTGEAAGTLCAWRWRRETP